MGVLACNRIKCNNIMCDTYVNTIGYICDECILEFKTYVNQQNISVKEYDVMQSTLENFMSIDKYSIHNDSSIDIDEFFKEYRNN